MKIMGLPGWLHWTAWFIKTFILYFISVALMTVFMTAKWYSGTDLAVLTHSNPFIIFLFFVCYACATITYCFAISVFFTKGIANAFFLYLLIIFIGTFSKHSIYSCWYHLVLVVFSIFQLAIGLRHFGSDRKTTIMHFF